MMTVKLTSKTDPYSAGVTIHNATHVSAGYNFEGKLLWFITTTDGPVRPRPVADWYCDVTDKED